MAQKSGREVLLAAVSEKEWKRVPSEIAKKIECFIGEKFDELISARALVETKSYNSVHALSELQAEFEVVSKENEAYKKRVEGFNLTIKELEHQLSISVADVSKFQINCNDLEHEINDLRTKYKTLSSSHEEQCRMVDRRSQEIQRMQSDINLLNQQLSEAVAEKCEALEKINEVESMKLSIEYKEKRLEQERALMQSQIQSLTEDLDAKIEEVLNLRRDKTSKCVQLEIKLSEKTAEFVAAEESIKKLNEANNNLMKKNDEIIGKLQTEKENYTASLEAFEHELEAQKKIADLYHGLNEDKLKHEEELEKAVIELQQKLDETLEKYGDLETKHKEDTLANEEIVQKKTECIEILKKELETANEILRNFKPDSLAREIEEISPGASAASRLLKTGMTMTELYTQYVQVSESLANEKSENARLQSYIQTIIAELEDKGPLIAKQREHYERALETVNEMAKQIENLTAENQHLRDTHTDLKRSEATASRESMRLKKENQDLSRQVCHLLREVEHSRVGSSSTSTDQYLSDSTSSADIITKRLVTFSDINDLQNTNQRLLALVRELSSKQEEAEAMGPEMLANLKMKLDSMSESHAELLEQQEKNNNMVKMLIEQRDNYKNLYHQFAKGIHDEISMEQDKSQPNSNKQEENEVTNAQIQELEASIVKLKKELAETKEELETYRKEKTANEKILIEQNDKMRSEVQELMRQNAKLCTKCETTAEMLKVHKSNIDVFKTQIERLEERNRIYNETIVKLETAQSYLKDQILEAQTRLSKSEVVANNLRNENALLKENESRLIRERESNQREHKSQSIMQKNIELIKATLVRNDAESKIRLEETLKEAHRECAALRRRLQEEQDRFREASDHLDKQKGITAKKLQDEKEVADKLRSDLIKAREDLAEKSVQLEELSKKLKNSLLGEIEGAVGGSIELKKYRELDHMLTNAQEEIETLKQKLKISKEAVEQHSNVANAAEKQLIDINEAHKKEKVEMEKKLSEQAALITDLEEKCSELQGELSIQNDGQVSTTTVLHTKLSKLEIQSKVTQTELEECREQLKEARKEITRLSEALEVSENKYSREMSLHSNDLQALRTVKEDLTKALTEMNEVKQERDSALESLEVSKASWETQEEMFKKGNADLEIRLKELDKQNALLLDQLQELNSQFSVMQAQLAEPQLNRSSGGDTSMNRSFAEDDIKSSEQLFKIIKYLRQEKDVAVSKCEILDAEHARIKAQFSILQQQFDEAKAALEEERQKSEISFVTSANHAEVLRKVETLNAITDSNRSLRIERDTLLAELNEHKARRIELENQLAPIQEKNTELTKKAEGMQSENITLRNEVTRWRQRANILIERSNRTSPEDWKKLQGERESLAKQLTIERANNTKLNEDINILTADKKKLEDQIKHLKIQQDAQKEDIEKLNKEVSSFKAQVSNLNTQLNESLANGIRLSEENRTLTEDLASKDISIADFKNNLTQIRKIAKKYKTQWEDKTKEVETLKQQLASKETEDVPEEKKAQFIQQGRSELEERINQLEQSHNEQMAALNQQVTNTVEENEKNRQEIENLKESLQTSLEKEERFKVLFKNAKDRIMNLTEQNNNLKSKINEDSKEFDSNVASGSSELEKRLIKEKEDILAEKQQEKERYIQEIETLTGRINQLQRQIGLQQATKPSTSSEKEKSSSETPTANIKPMASHSSNQTQSVSIQPWRSSTGEPPLASIRPMSMQNTRTAAVLPTSQSPSTAMVPPQQQVHTTGSSVMESMSSSPTSSHTDYVPATSSASSAMLGPRQVAVPPTQSNQVNEDDDSSRQVQAAPQQQAVALVLPRIETPAPAQEQGTSSTSSSNTVTTTQAAHKRPREADTESQHDDQNKIQQQSKKTRTVLGTVSGTEGSVSESGLEVEYQVPTSSQRDHEEDAVIVVESDEEGPDEGEGDDYNMPYEDPDTQDPDQDDEAGNEVEVIDDSSEVPNQSERGGESDIMQGDAEEDECEAAEEGEDDEEEEEVMQPEATSSGTNVSTSVAVTLPSFSRTRQVAPLSRQQQSHLLLPSGIEESGDDGIVPSTPTLFVARRCDGFGEAVSSPHVPTSGRFTFNESTAAINQGSNDVLPEQTLEVANADDNSTGRSVPSTPIQTSPHEAVPSNEEPSHQQGESDIPSITVSGADVEMDTAEGSMGPPAAGTSAEASDHVEDMQESDDGVSSEGEKAPSNEDGGEEEGREAEASPSTNTRSRNIRGMPSNMQQRRSSIRQSHVRGISRSPIVWSDQQRNQSPRQDHRNNRGNMNQNFATRGVARRRNRPQRPFGRF